jgi:hypothetical protein
MNEPALPPNSLSNWVRWFPTTVAGLEAVAVLIVMIVTVVGSLREGIGLSITDVTVEMLVLAAGFAGLVWLTRSLARCSPRAVAPFLVVQVLALVLAWDFIRSDEILTQTAGLALGAGAIIGSVLLLGSRRWL